MNREDIIRMAQEAGIEVDWSFDFKIRLEAFAKLVADHTYAEYLEQPKPKQAGVISVTIPKQAQQAEPVAWMNGRGDVFKNSDDAERGQTLTPLYTTPPQRKPDPVIDKSAAIRIATALGWTPPRQPLTDEEIINKADRFDWDKDCAVRFARAIEAAHGIKE